MSTRTSHADANYFSVSANTYQWFAGTPEARSDTQPPSDLTFRPDQPANWDAVLKICDETNGLRWYTVRAAQGRENALDLNNRVTDCLIKGEWGLDAASGDQVITVKGGCRGIRLWGEVYSTGRNADIVVGAWSDQCHDVSTDLDFSQLGRPDGRPLTVILARCKGVKLPPGARVLRLKSLGYSAYWWLKLAAVKLGVLR
jgi:hypothetical protein